LYGTIATFDKQLVMFWLATNKMPMYVLDITEDANHDLNYYRIYERKIIVDAIIVQLKHQPDTETGSRRMLRENPIARWELRIGKYRVFYEIDEENQVVSVVSVGHKEHNVLFIRGKEMQL
jgi:mRNA-degrading endonuclease RelE of RelBE toxin-antitoxin system